MSKLKELIKKKKAMEGVAGLIVIALVFAVLLPNAFATTAYYMPSASVELDGTNDGSVTIELKTPVTADFFSIEGNFYSGTSGGEFTLVSMTPATGMAPIKSNAVSDGRILWYDWDSEIPFRVEDGSVLWSATYTVDKDTAAGEYALCVTGLRIAREDLTNPIDHYATENVGNVCADVTVTRNEGGKPNQNVIFTDENNEPFTEITMRYGDDPFVVNIVPTEGEVVANSYHPMDEPGDPHVVTTDPNSNLVNVENVGSVQVCATIGETDNYAETTACYTAIVQKRPLDITGATIANKTYNGITDATVTSVSFQDRNLSNEEYNATAEFGSADAGSSKAIRVRVELSGDAANNYVLNSETYDTTAPIAPYQLSSSDAQLFNGNTYIYNPDGVTPEVRVYANIHNAVSTLEEGTDYELTYNNNVSVGVGHAVITGINNFTTGENPIDLAFTIQAQGITNDNLTIPNSIVVGHEIPLDRISVNVNGRDLVRCANDGDTDCDYVLSTSGGTSNVGDGVHVVVEGRNNYSGTAVGDISVVAKAEQNVVFRYLPSEIIERTYGDPKFTFTAETNGGGTITYRSSNESVATVNENSGEVTIVGVGEAQIIATAAEDANYVEGSASYTVRVSKKVLTVTDVTVSNKTYDGNPIATVSSVTLSESSLIYNTDFTATGLFNDVNAAIHDVTVMVALTDEMFNNYCFMSGESCLKNTSYSAVATITAFTPGADRESVTLNETSFTYSGNENKPTATVKVDLDGDGILETTLVDGTDYDMRYYNNINAGTGTAYVVAKGNYNFSVLGLSFTIEAAPVESVEVTAPSQDYTGSALEPVPTVTGIVNGSRVTFAADDYSVVAHGNFIEAGSYNFSVTSAAQGNYYIPTTTGTFTINKITSSNPPEMTANLKIETGKSLEELGERSVGFAWNNAATTVLEGEGNYPATYLQDNDYTNYTPIDVSVPVYGLKRVEMLTGIVGNGDVEGTSSSVLEGETITLKFIPDEGHELAMFYLNNIDYTDQVTNGQFSMTVGTDDITAVVLFRRVYNVINVVGTPHTRGVDGTAEFEIDANYELFEDDGVVYVDGEELSVENYDSWNASTVISLKAAYLDSLTAGEHSLRVAFADGGVARATFVVVDPAREGSTEGEGTSEESAKVADTGTFTGAVGGAVATGFTTMFISMFVCVVYKAVKKSKEA